MMRYQAVPMPSILRYPLTFHLGHMVIQQPVIHVGLKPLNLYPLLTRFEQLTVFASRDVS